MKKRLLFDDAFSLLREHMPRMATNIISIEDAYGKTLAAPVQANISVPPFPRAMMDGFAVRFKDIAQGLTTYHICGLAKAGEPFYGEVKTGECVRIMTGSAVPAGLDTVIRYEWCTELPDSRVEFHRFPTVPGESVQPAGEDGGAGSIVLTAGRILTGLDIAVARTFGVSHVSVLAPIQTALIITGDELIRDPDAPLNPGQIYGANDALIQYSLEEDGASVTSVQYVGDSKAALKSALETACHTHRLVVMTGGISAGDFDFVPSVVAELGHEFMIESVWMRPGSPFILAKRKDVVIVCLSGNPAAAFVQFEALVRPAIRCAMGQNDEPFPVSAILAHDVANKSIKHVRILRARAYVHEGQILVDAGHAQSPGVISSLADTNCLIRLNEDDYDSGAVLPLRWFRHP